MRVESARPGRGRAPGHEGGRERVVGDRRPATRAAAPFTRSSNRDRIRVSRTKRPWADPGDDVPAPPLMAKVDSSTRVTTPPAWPRPATLPLKVHGSLTGATLPDRRGLPNDQVGAFPGSPIGP